MDKNNLIVTSHRDKVDVDINDQLEDMIRDNEEDYFRKYRVYDMLCSDKEELLYKGCSQFTQFSVFLRLFKMGGQIKVSLNFLDCWNKFF